MSVMRVGDAAGTPPAPLPPRVREQVRAALVLMAFSAGVSVVMTLLLLVVTGLGH